MDQKVLALLEDAGLAHSKNGGRLTSGNALGKSQDRAETHLTTALSLLANATDRLARPMPEVDEVDSSSLGDAANTVSNVLKSAIGVDSSATTAQGLLSTVISGSSPASGSGFGQSVTKTAKGLLSGLLGGFPLFSGLASLFGGGHEEPPPLVKYETPESQHFNLALSGGRLGEASYDGAGTLRTTPFAQLAFAGLDQETASPVSQREASQASGPANITIQVQAMDSRSFLEHSGDIAAAVRNALLNSHSLGDVIADL